MTPVPYDEATTSTAFPPETARRQFLRAAVFIDGNNWYNRMKELLNNSISSDQHAIRPPIYYNLRGLFELLIIPAQLVSITYYKGVLKNIPGNIRTEKMYADEQRLFKFLRDKQNINLSFGRVIHHPDGSWHEKGVDLRLAIDMMKMCVANQYDIAFVVSSDNDLSPAIQECRALGKEVIHVGSFIKPSFGLQKICTRSILLQQKDLLPFMPIV